MAADVPAGQRRHDAASWAEIHARLAAVDPAALDAEDLDLLAEAAYWCSRTDVSIAAREQAHRRFVDAGATLFAAVLSGYILVGVRLEERDLCPALPGYARYAARTPRFVPLPSAAHARRPLEASRGRRVSRQEGSPRPPVSRARPS